ncbi:MAG: oligopeptide ABC transporter substrate-binding protein [Oscillospiraceae bacterium]|jgi:peptide/nickel transport system substrate-binding protein|nr:oligopeptide ABC transporter substrate-binding protein [Oscillospiraceae bacterium]
MNKKKILSLSLSLLLAVTLLSSCAQTSGNDSGGDQDLSSGAQGALAGFPWGVENTAKSINGGVLKYAIDSDAPFQGLLLTEIYEDDLDAQVLSWFVEGFVSYDENFVADQDGAATYTFDKDAKTITLTMREGVKWHDGEPVTLDDMVFGYEILAHPDYQGTRFDDSVRNVIGVDEYHDGTADKISGLALSEDEMTLTISFKEFTPTILIGGFWTSGAPRHYLGDVAVKDLTTSEKVKTNPIGFGPFKVKTIVPGESVEFERFDDYWRGKPKLDGVQVRVINPDLIPQALEAGEIDIASFNTQVYPDYKNPTNYTYIAQLETSFNYTGFDLGTFDTETETNIADPNKKMANLNLRKAIGYAINQTEICQQQYNGLRMLATTAITPRHGGYQNTEIEGYVYDPERSKTLLDEANYKDTDGDGYREDPNGQQLTIYWAFMSGAGAEVMTQYKIQQWKEVGLRVELYNGQLMEFNNFYNALQNDEEGIDMFDGAWQTGFDPDPNVLWGEFTVNNFPHAVTDELRAAMADCASEQSWDETFRTNAYKKWQEEFFNACTAIPTMWRAGLFAVNNRVKNYDMSSVDIDAKLHLIELTANESAVKQ